MPGFALKVALGQFADDILGSQNVVPSRLKDAGFKWVAPAITDALVDMDYA